MAEIFNYSDLSSRHLKGENDCKEPFIGRKVSSLKPQEIERLNRCNAQNEQDNKGDIVRFFQAVDMYNSLVRDEYNKERIIGVSRTVYREEITPEEIQKLDIKKDGLDNEDVRTLYTRLQDAAQQLESQGIGIAYPVRWSPALAKDVTEYLKTKDFDFYRRAFPNNPDVKKINEELEKQKPRGCGWGF